MTDTVDDRSDFDVDLSSYNTNQPYFSAATGTVVDGRSDARRAQGFIDEAVMVLSGIDPAGLDTRDKILYAQAAAAVATALRAAGPAQASGPSRDRTYA